MTSIPRQVIIVAGEVSGDRLAASLIRKVKQLSPNTVFRGVTGPAMRSEGCLSDAYIDDMYGSKYTKHFYSEKEIETFKKRWSNTAKS